MCNRLAFILGFVLTVSCVRFDAIVADVKSCIQDSAPQDVKDLEAQAVPFIERVLLCDPGFSTAALPVCVEQGLAGIVVALGPDGERFRLCVVNKIENDPAAAQLARTRAKAFRVKMDARGGATPSCDGAGGAGGFDAGTGG